MEHELPTLYDLLNYSERKEVREQYVEKQKGLCNFCNRPLDGPPAVRVDKARINKNLFPPNMFKYPVHLDHDHNTGLTRGAVHAKCNAYLWQYKGK